MSSAFGPRGYVPGDPLLVCQRRQDDRYVDVVAGSRIIVADCGHYATVSSSGVAVLADDEAFRSICTRCYADDDRLRERPYEPFMAPGAKDELRKSMPDEKDAPFLKWVTNSFKEM